MAEMMRSFSYPKNCSEDDVAALKRKFDLENAVPSKKPHVDEAAEPVKKLPISGEAEAATQKQAEAEAAAKKREAEAAAQKREAEAAALRKAAAAETAAMMATVRAWDVASLKAFIAALPKEEFDAKQGKKADMVETVQKQIYHGLLGQATTRSWRGGYASGAEIKRYVLDAFAQASKASASAASKKSMDPATRALESRLAPLDKAQLVDVVLKLAAKDRAAVEALLPSQGDVAPVVADLDRKVKAIAKALPNSRFGSNADAYGYKRAASANAEAKKAFMDAIATYKKAKAWATAAAFAERALPVARNMVHFDSADHNKARTAVEDALVKLLAEAKSHV